MNDGAQIVEQIRQRIGYYNRPRLWPLRTDWPALILQVLFAIVLVGFIILFSYAMKRDNERAAQCHAMGMDTITIGRGPLLCIDKDNRLVVPHD